MLSRRAFLRAAAVGIGGLAIGSAAADLSAHGYTGTAHVERLIVRIGGLPKEFNSYKIGFLTDLHLGLWVPQTWIAAALDILVAHNIDLLLLGGDYIFITDNPIWSASHYVRNSDYLGLKRPEMVASAFSDVLGILASYSFRDGVIGVVGNHDRWNSYFQFQQACAKVPQLRFLVNQGARISRGDVALEIFGVDDYLTGIPSSPPSRSGASSHLCRILLSHNPDFVSALLKIDAEAFDLALCGHTHGGQIRLPGLTGALIPVQDPRFMAGMTKLEGGAVYTSRGLGVVGLPFRVNCPPEITIFELQASES